MSIFMPKIIIVSYGITLQHIGPIRRLQFLAERAPTRAYASVASVCDVMCCG